jgi:hypothetical protein
MAGSARDDDGESVLDLREQTNRPNDTAFNQQRVPGWSPILDPVWVIIGLFYFGIIMVPVGTSWRVGLVEILPDRATVPALALVHRFGADSLFSHTNTQASRLT